ncbi:hypothetical protein LFM09_07390 [Lentzea alba]|uniref:hypothetical protein n=1 Tax=Lentzea alba TaxID=2714351 RepID=UPI0039BF84A1
MKRGAFRMGRQARTACGRGEVYRQEERDQCVTEDDMSLIAHMREELDTLDPTRVER